MNTRSIRRTLEKREPVHEVRRLLIHLVNGPGQTALSQLIGADHMNIDTGTQYDMEQEADGLAQAWVNEGFEAVPEDRVLHEPLKATVVLVKLEGYTTVQDPRYQNLKDSRRRLNPFGEIPLDEWPGMTPKSGGGYLYAFVGGKIHAQPTLPPNHNLGAAPIGMKEYAAYMAKVLAMLKAVGPSGSFPLGGN